MIVEDLYSLKDTLFDQANHYRTSDLTEESTGVRFILGGNYVTVIVNQVTCPGIIAAMFVAIVESLAAKCYVLQKRLQDSVLELETDHRDRRLLLLVLSYRYIFIIDLMPSFAIHII